MGKRRYTMTRPGQEMKEPEIEELTLCRDDFIEWLLQSTSDDSEFRVYKTKSTISVHIDRSPFT